MVSDGSHVLCQYHNGVNVVQYSAGVVVRLLHHVSCDWLADVCRVPLLSYRADPVSKM